MGKEDKPKESKEPKKHRRKKDDSHDDEKKDKPKDVMDETSTDTQAIAQTIVEHTNGKDSSTKKHTSTSEEKSDVLHITLKKKSQSSNESIEDTKTSVRNSLNRPPPAEKKKPQKGMMFGEPVVPPEEFYDPRGMNEAASKKDPHMGIEESVSMTTVEEASKEKNMSIKEKLSMISNDTKESSFDERNVRIVPPPRQYGPQVKGPVVKQVENGDHTESDDVSYKKRRYDDFKDPLNGVDTCPANSVFMCMNHATERGVPSRTIIVAPNVKAANEMLESSLINRGLYGIDQHPYKITKLNLSEPKVYMLTDFDRYTER